jgi:hypothetical protein
MDREEGIRIIAYHIWEQEGRNCHGSDVEHWLKAETLWQSQNRPLRTVAEMEPSPGNQQINVAGKVKPHTLVGMQQNKKGQFSRRKP